MKLQLFKTHVYIVSVLIPLLDNIFGLKQILKVLTPPTRCEPYKGIPAKKICDIISKRLKKPLLMKRRKCLRHGLTLFHFFCLSGLPAVLHIGVFEHKEYDKRMDAHCWVTCDGKSFSPEPQEDVAEVLTYRKIQT